ncbi:MAG: recombinase family protein [Candidatus Tectomicrobia bacterium]|nr:recombinase family protein [Candidatus Tectomicrobia bacterium]
MASQQRCAAIYVRVSNAGQKHASQEPDLKRWAEQNDGPARWYRDTFTGTTMQRPGFERLMEAVRAGPACTQASTAWSRFRSSASSREGNRGWSSTAWSIRAGGWRPRRFMG